MNKSKLIQSLVDQATKLPHRDKIALDRLIRRAQMILKNISTKEPYTAAMLNIDFSPPFGSAEEQYYNQYWESGKEQLLNLFRTIQEEIELFGEKDVEKIQNVEFSKRIFIVHGHDKEIEAEIARTIEQLDLEPIILHEQPDRSRTLIEKFTDYSDVGCAIVLLSPDDYGYSKDEAFRKKKLRARQNVIFELGFFLGKLGREKTLVVHRKANNFEIPTDYSGVLYIPYDDQGAWKYKIVKELKILGYRVSADMLQEIIKK